MSVVHSQAVGVGYPVVSSVLSCCGYAKTARARARACVCVRKRCGCLVLLASAFLRI